MEGGEELLLGMLRRALGLGGLIALLAGSTTAGEVEITYLANEGFLISAGESKVLIDGLFPGIDGFPRLPADLAADLESGRPPFDGIDLVLVTHHHDDHFGPGEVARFLATQPAVLVSTRQVLDRLRDPRSSGSPDRVSPAPGSSATVEAAGVRVDTVDLHHGRYRKPAVENLGFVIDVDGLKVLHIGDTEATVEDFSPLRLAEIGIDVALLPVWYLTEPRWQAVVAQEIRPKSIVAMHLAEPHAPASWFGSAGGFEERIERVMAAWPDAWIPTAPLDCRRFGSNASPAAVCGDRP